MSEQVTPSAADGPEAPEILCFGPFLFDRRKGLLVRSGTEVALTGKARDLLECLLEQPRSVVPKEELLKRIWGDTAVTDHSLTEAVRALRKTLGDDPRRPRFIQTVHREGYRFIAAVSAEGRPFPATVGTEQPRNGRAPLLLAVSGALLLTLAVGLFMTRAEPSAAPDPAGATFLALTIPDDVLLKNCPMCLAFSPDGKRVSYMGAHEGAQAVGDGRDLLVHRMDGTGVQVVDVPGVPYGADFSPEGDWLASFRWHGGENFSLVKSPLDGGPAVVLVEKISFPRGLSWGSRGNIVYSHRDEPGLWVVPVDDPASRVLIAEESGLTYSGLDFLPDGKSIVATAGSFTPFRADPHIVALSLDSGEPKRLLEGGGRVRYASSGHLLISRDEQLLAVPFDPESLEVRGKLRPVLDRVVGSFFDVSHAGTLVYLSTEFAAAGIDAVLVDRDGKTTSLGLGPGLWRPQLSPDGTEMVALKFGTTSRDLYKHTLGRGNALTRLTFGETVSSPIFTPEGNRVTFALLRDGSYNLFWMPKDGGTPELLFESPDYSTPESWSPDGSTLAFIEASVDDEDIWLLRLDGREAKPFLETEHIESGASFSPDGRYIAYHSDESGRFEIYVRPVPEELDTYDPSGVGVKKQVSTTCGGFPIWGDNGELFFRDCSNNELFFSVDIETEPEIRIGEPRELFRVPSPFARPGKLFSVTPDGQQFLLMQMQDRPVRRRLEIVLNWFEELKRLVPTAR